MFIKRLLEDKIVPLVNQEKEWHILELVDSEPRTSLPYASLPQKFKCELQLVKLYSTCDVVKDPHTDVVEKVVTQYSTSSKRELFVIVNFIRKTFDTKIR